MEETEVGMCWRWNLDKSTRKLITLGESEEEPVGEEFNIGAGREGEPAGEVAGETATTGELAGERPGEMATTLGDSCECEESELALEEWSW